MALGLPSVVFLIEDRLVSYAVVVCFGADVLADLLRVARGTAAWVVVVCSTTGALADLLRVVLAVAVSVVLVCSAVDVLTRTSRLRVF